LGKGGRKIHKNEPESMQLLVYFSRFTLTRWARNAECKNEKFIR